MKANYKPRVKIPGLVDRCVSEREYKLALQVYEYAKEQFELAEKTVEEDQARLMDAALETYLVVLHRRYNYGARVLREIWEETIRLRAGLRTFLRDIGDGESGYTILRHGENIEDTAIRMELSEIGVDVRAWEASVRYDERSGEVTFEEVRA